MGVISLHSRSLRAGVGGLLLVRQTGVLGGPYHSRPAANVYVAGSRFVIEHAVQGTLVKEGALYSRVEDAYFYYRVVFRDGTAYYFTPSFTGIWQAFIKDSQGYSNYVRGLIQAPTTAANAL
jgi:hypothetical protein